MERVCTFISIFFCQADKCPSCLSGCRNHHSVAVFVGNCLQEVSPLGLALLDYSAVCKQPLLFIVSTTREVEGERRDSTLGTERESGRGREVKSVFRNVPWQASGRLSPDDWEGILGRGEAGEPRSTPPALSLSLTSPSTLQSALFFTQSIFVCSRPVCSVKNIKPRRRINEETIFYV